MFSVLESDCLQTNNTENQTFDNAEAFNITEIYTLIPRTAYNTIVTPG